MCLKLEGGEEKSEERRRLWQGHSALRGLLNSHLWGGVGNADGNSVKQQQSRTQSKTNSEEIPARTGRQATRQRAAGLSFAWATK